MAEAHARDDRTGRVVRDPNIAVCVPTFKRPVFLERLLQSLVELQRDDLSMRVIVVDNDAAGSAEPVVKRFVALLPHVVYEVEPERGIAAARNRLVSIASRLGADCLAFVDDDEWVEPTWLRNLVRTIRDHEADVVIGAVLPQYAPEIPAWVVAGGFFERPRQRTGERARGYTTANVLFRRSCLDGLEGPFHRAFDLTGGSDSHLFERLIQRGARMVWCDDAVVHDHVPASRGNARWILKRAFRNGITYARCARMLDPLPRQIVRTYRLLGCLGRGLVLLGPSLPRGKAATVRTLRDCAMGLGGMVGMVGVTYQEYRQTHGG